VPPVHEGYHTASMPIDSGYDGPGGRREPLTVRAGTAAGPRSAPSATTGAEASYVVKQIEARTPMVFKLMGGERVRGVIEYYDRDLLKVVRSDGPSLLLRKDQIAYMHKA
jgi:hypothetical protein